MNREFNSHEYWDKRFSSGDWDEKAGDEQSAFFSKIAQGAFPYWLEDELQNNDWTIMDIGCAEGGGTAVLADCYPACQVTGVDFSAEAIARAERRHLNCKFTQGEIHQLKESVDVMFASNLLEYLHDPFDCVRLISENVKHHIILLHPLNNTMAPDEPVQVFTEESFPLRIGDFVLSFFKIIDCATLESTYWSGEQIMTIYSRESVLPQDRSLRDLCDNSECLALRNYNEKLLAENSILTDGLQERDNRIARALWQLENLSKTKLFRLVHLMNRAVCQGLSKDKSERKEFWKWFFGRFTHRPDRNRKYDPLFTVMSLLDKQVKSMDAHGKAYLNGAYKKYDVIIFAAIDYTFRYQRPQQIADFFAKAGHRVFYINSSFSTSESIGMSEIKHNLYEISLPNGACNDIYSTNFEDEEANIEALLDQLVYKNGIRDALLIANYPNWIKGLLHLKKVYGFKLVTDYMDDYSDFDNADDRFIGEASVSLLRESDAIVASSNYLGMKAKAINENVEIVRNGTDFSHFSQARTGKTEGKKVIGYYGAIAHWFEIEKIEYLSERFPEVEIALIGRVSEWETRLKRLKNVMMYGEKPYIDLPDYLKEFDVCLIPFDASTSLIQATNPVKFYEYLSAGKKVVATEIPELEPFKDKYVYLANDNELFGDYVELCLNGKDSLATPEECQKFAQGNEWSARVERFSEVAERCFPKISIIVLCYNQLEYTKICVQSILDKTAYPNYELILVDNNSTDNTAEYLKQVEKENKTVKVVLNKTNRGFAGGNNDGIAKADGDYIVLLNNDAVVTRGWLTGLLKHFENDAAVGLVGPVTNSIGNEARIPVEYADDLVQMEAFANEYTFMHRGEEYPHQGILAMFCLMISRELYNRVGPLDENYGIGMFEDDDYSIASERNGYRNVMAEDVFIHHFGNVSFKKLEEKTYKDLFNKNKAYYEKKWRERWRKPFYRPGVN